MQRKTFDSVSHILFVIVISILTPGIAELKAQEGNPVIDTTGLVAYYDFSGSYRDSMGNNADAISHLTEFTEDRFCLPQRALALTETGSYLQIVDDPSLNFTDTLSISFWLHLDTIPESDTRIISKSDPANPESGSYWITIHPDPELENINGHPWSFSFRDSEGSVNTFKAEWGMHKQSWMLYSVTFDGSELILYMGAEPVAIFETAITSILPDTNDLWIGNSTGSGFTGKVDEVLLYDRVIQAGEFENLLSMASFVPDDHKLIFEAEIGDTVELYTMAYGSFVQYQFFKGEELIQEGPDSICKVVIKSEADYDYYSCRAYNCLYESIKKYKIKSCALYEDIYIYDVSSTEIYASEGDEVHIWFYVNSNLEGLEYEMYHNGNLLPDVFRGIYTIEQATLADSGAYYFVVINGCERLVSDTVYLIMEGLEYVYTEVEGWDWTGNISSAGSSYFSSICAGPDSSFCLLGHYAGGLKVEGMEVFSSGSDDIFIVKYDKEGVYRWSRFLVSTGGKGKGDLAMDSEGNVYVSGSYWDSLQIEDVRLTTVRVGGTGYLAKYNPSGQLLWIRDLKTTRGLNCDNIEIDSADHIYLGGNFSGSLKIDTVFTRGDWDQYANVLFLARMDTSGACHWISHAVTDPFMDLFGLIDMDLNKNGEVVASGTMTAEADFGNGVVLSTAIEAPFLVKYDSAGLAEWGTTLASDFSFAEAFDVSVDDLDRIFLTGMHLGEIAFGDLTVGSQDPVMEEIFLARFDSAGLCTALNSYGSLGEGGDFGICYEPLSDTSGYLLGLFGDTLIMKLDTLIAGAVSGGVGPISPNMFIAKLSAEGEPLALQSAGVIGNQFYGEILVRGDGRLYFAGLNEGVAVKKSSMVERNPIAFVGYKEHGIVERTGPLELEFNYQETICQGDSLQFRGLWYKEAGTYRDTAYNPIGIDSIFSLKLSTEICSSIDDQAVIGDYQIYPNPANHILYVYSPDGEPFELKMFGMTGQRIWQNRDQHEYQINLQGYEPGLYILKMIKQGESKVHKVLIE